MNRFGEPLTVEDLLHDAGILVGLHDFQAISEKLKQEFIVEVWQLRRMDSTHWACLGVPIGFSVALQHVLEYSGHASNGVVESLSAPRNANFAVGPLRKSERKTMFAVPVSEPPVETCRASAQKVSVLSECISVSCESQGTPPEVSNYTIRRRFLAYLNLASIIDCVFPFFHRKIVKRAILHGKSCEEIREFMYRKAELYFFWSALLTGVVAEVWGQFPSEDIEQVPPYLYIVSYSLSLISTVTGISATALNIVLISVSCGVEPQKFKEFYNIAMDFEMMIEYVLFAAIYVTVTNLFVLTYAKYLVVLQDSDIIDSILLLLGLVVSLLGILCFPIVYLYDEMARFSLHGGLFNKHPTNGVDLRPKSNPAEKEVVLQNAVLRNLERRAEQAIVDCALAFDYQAWRKSKIVEGVMKSTVANDLMKPNQMPHSQPDLHHLSASMEKVPRKQDDVSEAKLKVSL